MVSAPATTASVKVSAVLAANDSMNTCQQVAAFFVIGHVVQDSQMPLFDIAIKYGQAICLGASDEQVLAAGIDVQQPRPFHAIVDAFVLLQELKFVLFNRKRGHRSRSTGVGDINKTGVRRYRDRNRKLQSLHVIDSLLLPADFGQLSSFGITGIQRH